MTEDQFRPGDVVRLHSGGPTMTVSSIGVDYDPSLVNCEWFAGEQIKHGSFKPPMLELIRRPD